MKKLDVTGLECPEPLMEVRREVRHMEIGERLEVIADDPSTQRDIPSFCHFMSHTLVKKECDKPPFVYVIEVGC